MDYKKIIRFLLTPLTFLALLISSTAPISTSLLFINQIKCPEELIK